MLGEDVLRISPLSFVLMRYLCVGAHYEGRGARLFSSTGHDTCSHSLGEEPDRLHKAVGE